jgi:hypothetical protein
MLLSRSARFVDSIVTDLLWLWMRCANAKKWAGVRWTYNLDSHQKAPKDLSECKLETVLGGEGALLRYAVNRFTPAEAMRDYATRIAFCTPPLSYEIAMQ